MSDKPSQSPAHETQLTRLKDIAVEHFDEYLLIVSKDGQVWNTYKSKCSAHGMASMVISDIHRDWAVNED